jgi:hypothetical protein
MIVLLSYSIYTSPRVLASYQNQVYVYGTCATPLTIPVHPVYVATPVERVTAMRIAVATNSRAVAYVNTVFIVAIVITVLLYFGLYCNSTSYIY